MKRGEKKKLEISSSRSSKHCLFNGSSVVGKMTSKVLNCKVDWNTGSSASSISMFMKFSVNLEAKYRDRFGIHRRDLVTVNGGAMAHIFVWAKVLKIQEQLEVQMDERGSCHFYINQYLEKNKR